LKVGSPARQAAAPSLPRVQPAVRPPLTQRLRLYLRFPYLSLPRLQSLTRQSRRASRLRSLLRVAQLVVRVRAASRCSRASTPTGCRPLLRSASREVLRPTGREKLPPGKKTIVACRRFK